MSRNKDSTTQQQTIIVHIVDGNFNEKYFMWRKRFVKYFYCTSQNYNKIPY